MIKPKMMWPKMFEEINSSAVRDIRSIQLLYIREYAACLFISQLK